MEHYNLTREILSEFSTITDDQIRLLSLYADEINAKNSLFNLTGHQSIELILTDLIKNSIAPLIKMNVPRGTSFADLGTGAGIPGIPLAIVINNMNGTLIDSNSKKTRFISRTAQLLNLHNIKAVTARTEEAGKDKELRGKFDWVISRAMSDAYTITEMAAPLLKEGGRLYMYSRDHAEDMPKKVLEHIKILGLQICTKEEHRSILNQEETEGILIKKTGRTDDKYPRRISTIKREASKIY